MKILLRRLRKIVAIVLIVAVALGVGAYLLRERVLSKPLGQLIAGILSDSLGGRFTVERVTGDLHSEITLIGLKTEEEPTTGAVRRIEAERVTVRFSLPGLLGGDGLAAIHSVAVSGAEVVLDNSGPAKPEPEDDEPPGPLPARLPRIDLAGKLTVRGGRLGAEHFRIAGDGTTFTIELRDLTLPLDTPPASFRATLKRTKPQVFELTSEDALAGITPERLTVRVPASEPFALQGQLKAAAGSLSINMSPAKRTVTTRDLDLAKLPPWINAYATLPEAGVANLSFMSADGEPARVDGKITNLRWDDWVAEVVSIRGEWGAGAGRIERVEVESTRGSVLIENLEVDPARAYRVGALDRARIDIPDLARFLEKLPLDDLRASFPKDPIAVRVDMQRSDDRIDVRRLEFVHGESRLSMTGSARLPTQPGAWRDTALDLTLVGGVHRPHALARTAAVPVIEGVLKLQGRITGNLETPVVDLSLDGRKLVVADRDVAAFTMKGRLAWPRLEVREFVLDAAPGSVRGAGVADLAAQSVSGASLTLAVKDLAGLMGMFPGAPRLEGAVSGTIKDLGASPGHWSGTVSLEGKRLRMDATDIGAAKVRAHADGRKLTIEQLEVRGASGNLFARGTCVIEEKGLRARLERIEATRDGRTVKTLAPLEVVARRNGFEAPALHLAVLGGTVRGSAGSRDGRLDLDLTAKGLRVEQVLADWVGAADATIKLSGTPEAPVFDLRVSAPRIEQSDVTGEIELDVRQDARGLRLRDLRILAEGTRVTGSGELPWVVGAGGLRRIDGVPPRLDLSAVLERWPENRLGFLPVRCKALSATIKADATALDARVRVQGLALTSDPPFSMPGTARLDLTVTRDAVAAEWHEGGEGDLTMRGSARLGAGGDWLDPVGLWKAAGDASLTGRLTTVIPDLKLLRRWAKGVRRIEGSAQVDIAAAGTAKEPRLSGTVRLDARDLSLENGPPTIQTLKTELRLDGDRVAIESCNGTMGYAPFRVAGAVRLAPHAEFDLRLVGKNLLLVSDQQLRLRTDLDLVWKGEADDANLTGSVRITDALYASRIDIVAAVVGMATSSDDDDQPKQPSPMFSLSGEPLRSTRFDVAVSASQSISIFTNVIRGRASAQLRLRGTGEVPLPVGTVHVRRPRVGLALGVVQADHALITFTEDDPFQPTVRVFGNIRPFLTTQLMTDDPEKDGLLDRIQIEIDTETLARDELRLDQVGLTAEIKLTDKWYLFAENYRRNEYGAGILWRIRFR